MTRLDWAALGDGPGLHQSFSGDNATNPETQTFPGFLGVFLLLPFGSSIFGHLAPFWGIVEFENKNKPTF